MRTILTANRSVMGKWVAEQAAATIRGAIAEHGNANIVIATGASQFEVLAELAELAAQPNIDWSLVTGFHLDEYIGLSPEHPASFCKYLKERFVDHVNLNEFHYLRGDRDASEVISETAGLLRETSIDVALVGIGENSHLAFNDPPADFETTDPYLIVQLDEACRRQQVGEGWFPTLEDVPQQAISMSVHQILQAKQIFCSVPDSQKADAVAKTLLGDITPDVPASILRRHPNATLIIDKASAGNLPQPLQSAMECVS